MKAPIHKIFLVTMLLSVAGFIGGYSLGSRYGFLDSLLSVQTLSTPPFLPTNLTVHTVNNHTLHFKMERIVTAERTTVPPATTSAMRTGDLTLWFNGGLGNQMFEYAALVGIAKSNNITPFVQKGDYVTTLFTLGAPTLINEQRTDFTKLERVGESLNCAYDSRAEHLDLKGKVANLQGYRQSWKYFANFNETIRRHFTFKDHIQLPATTFLKTVKISRPNVTTVAIHIRRGDILADNFKTYGYLVPDRNYFNKSMNYFRQKYQNVLFIVCSNGMDWAKSSLVAINNDVIYVEGKSAPVDFSIMAHCDHMIMSVGSFGWWAAWLTGGEVIYYKPPARPGSTLAAQFRYEDYYPPSWIDME